MQLRWTAEERFCGFKEGAKVGRSCSTPITYTWDRSLGLSAEEVHLAGLHTWTVVAQM
jgi:hypothetical protein